MVRRLSAQDDANTATSNVNITSGSITGITDLAVADGGTGASTLTGIVKGNGASPFTAVTAPAGALVGTTDTQVLTGKTISGASNTLSNIANASLTNSSVTIGSTAVALGATAATLAGVTLTTPTIASFVNAIHNHTAAAGGGQLTDAALSAAVSAAKGGTGLTGPGAANNVLVSNGTTWISGIPVGASVQQVTTPATGSFSAVATGVTALPYDDTIPQQTEGIEFLTMTITPKAAGNLLVISVYMFLSSSVINNVGAALFQDATANALAVGFSTLSLANASLTIGFQFTMLTASTSATTFKVRCGGNAGGTITFNGFGGNRVYGTTPKSSMVIAEYAL